MCADSANDDVSDYLVGTRLRPPEVTVFKFCIWPDRQCLPLRPVVIRVTTVPPAGGLQRWRVAGGCSISESRSPSQCHGSDSSLSSEALALILKFRSRVTEDHWVVLVQICLRQDSRFCHCLPVPFKFKLPPVARSSGCSSLS